MGCVIGLKQLTYIEAAQKGDLIAVSYDNAYAIGLVVELGENIEPLIGLLTSSWEIPRLFRLYKNAVCMNYGQDWAFEPKIAQTSFPSHFEINRRAGLLVLTETGWAMNFASSGIDQFGRFNCEWLDLQTYEMSKNLHRGAVFEQWSIWANKKDRDTGTREPLLTYKAQIQGSTGR